MQKAIKSYIDYLAREKRYSSHTVTAYEKDLLQLMVFLTEHLEIQEVQLVKHVHVRSWIVALAEDGISNRSINRKVISVRNFYKYLRKSIFDIVNPCDKIRALKTPKRLPVYLKEEELADVFVSIVKDADDPFQWRDFLIVELLYNTGIRRSELINLKKVDVSLARGSIRVLGKGNKERMVPLSFRLIANFKLYLDVLKTSGFDDSRFIFSSPNSNKLYPKAVYNIVKKHLSLLTTVEKKSPHVLRHSFATHMMNGGAELNAVKEILGHASLAATQVYTHNSIEELKSVYKKAHPKG